MMFSKLTYLDCRELSVICISILLTIPTVHAQTFRNINSVIGINKGAIDQHIMAGGVALFDYNQDFYPDILILGGETSNALYRNNWDGSYTDVSHEAGVALNDRNTFGVAVADIDNDGDEDLFITTGSGDSHILLENQGDGTFADISQKAGITQKAWGTSATFGDFNLDGLVDIYVNNYVEYSNIPFEKNISRCLPNFLYVNQGDNTFTELATIYGVADIGCGLAVSFTDCDLDHDIDLYVANDFGFDYEPNELYVNNYPESLFSRSPLSAQVQAKINAMGIAPGDYDEDGDLDYYVTNMGDNPFFESIGPAQFENVAHQKELANADGTSWGTAFLDFDNDTYLDLTVANGQVVPGAIHQNNENRLFRGTDSLQFEDVSVSVGLANPNRCRGLSLGDIDLDGDLDLLFGVVSNKSVQDSSAILYQNDLDNNNHWLKIKLVGSSTHRNAYGSRIELYVDGRKLVREADGGSSYLSQHSSEIHFGLGSNAKVDSLVISWLGGDREQFYDIQADQHIIVTQDESLLPYRHVTASIFDGDSIFLASSFQKSAGIYHDIVTNSDGSASLIITKLSIEDRPKLDIPSGSLWVAPNPSRNIVSIGYSIQRDDAVILRLVDMAGIQVKDLMIADRKQGEFQESYDLSDLAPGVYFVIMSGQHINISARIIKIE